jgi:predicted signal transduction protein with EAL and GGDEF domain
MRRIPASSFSPLFDTGSVLDGLSFALIAFGTLLFTVVMSFLLLNMTKERTELQHKINAMIDPLSGVANRRAFLEGAGKLLAHHEIDNEPLAMVLFDLDRFKEINDRMTTTTLGTDVLFGRIGGRRVCRVHARWRSWRGLCGG